MRGTFHARKAKKGLSGRKKKKTNPIQINLLSFSGLREGSGEIDALTT